MSPRVTRGKPVIRTDCAKPKGGTVTVRQSIRGQESPMRKRARQGRKLVLEVADDEQPEQEEKGEDE